MVSEETVTSQLWDYRADHSSVCEEEEGLHNNIIHPLLQKKGHPNSKIILLSIPLKMVALCITFNIKKASRKIHVILNDTNHSSLPVQV